ncbi:hypothetical protein AB4Y90_06995 [Chryseobacterium sp. 2TAF14]|uniref:hypothetical protein n=1 Tax=Chryseobacterium sp. 2TAF14 TaxID=3233007 RepID=UPI003F8F505D
MKNFILITAILSSGITFGQYTNSPVPPPTTNRYPSSINVPSAVDVLAIYEDPDQIAQFPEGIEAYRNKIKKLANLDKVKTTNNESSLKSAISFVVERDGTITDVQVVGNDESFASEIKKVALNIKDRWEPAKLKGETVRSKFRVLLSMYKE